MVDKRHCEKVLTTRQKQVLAGIARGLNNPAIGRELGINGSAVATHVNSIYANLLIGSDVTREELPQRARELGVVFEARKEL